MSEIVTAIIAVGVAIGGTGTMFRFLNGRINTVKKDVNEDLKRGEAKFDKIMETLEGHGKSLVKIKTDIEWMRKNGK